MKLLHLLLAAAAAAVASAQSADILQALAEAPACGIACLVKNAPILGCDVMNVTCQCTNPRLGRLSADCLQANCTMEETFSMGKISAGLCNFPHQDRSHTMTGIITTVMVVSFLIVSLRIISRLNFNKALAVDDYFVLFALCITLANGVCVNRMAHMGFGRHFFDYTFPVYTYLLQQLYIAEILYTPNMLLIKWSILVFYLRIFTQPWFRFLCKIAIGFVAIPSIISLGMSIFQCRPIAFAWDKSIEGGYCPINLGNLSITFSVFSIAQDLVILCLPIYPVLKLQMNARKKLSFVAIFVVGGLTCVATTIRARYAVAVRFTYDPTWDFAPFMWTSAIEFAAGFACSCLPAIHQFFKHRFSKPESFSAKSSGYTKSSSGNSGPRFLKKKGNHSILMDTLPGEEIDEEGRRRDTLAYTGGGSGEFIEGKFEEEGGKVEVSEGRR